MHNLRMETGKEDNMKLLKKIKWTPGMTVLILGISVCLLAMNQTKEKKARLRVEREVYDLQIRLDAIELKARAMRMEMDFVRLDNYFRLKIKGWNKCH
jgi:hypothetical protein